MAKKQAILYLIPTPLAENAEFTLPEYVISQIHSLDLFVVERAKTARAFLKVIGHPKKMQNIDIRELDKHADYQSWEDLLEPLTRGKKMGFLSEAGCPGMADPGAEAVKWARKQGVEIKPLVGPSSVLLALMASGMNGQNFVFHGYLPNKADALRRKIKEMERAIDQENQTQIFIETPYRNEKLIKSLIELTHPSKKLCVASDLTGESEKIVVLEMRDWKRRDLSYLNKIPAIFLMNH